jgi:hypothetical protein
MSNILSEVFVMLQSREERTAYQTFMNAGLASGGSFEDSVLIESGARIVGQDKEQFHQLSLTLPEPKMDREAFMADLGRQIEDLMKANVSIARKLDTLQETLGEMSARIERHSAQVLKAVNNLSARRPYERIWDKVCVVL